MKESFTSAGEFPLKLLHNKITKQGKIIPLHLQIIPTNRCNLNCTFCSCKDREKSLEWKVEDLVILLNNAKELGTKSITWTGGGEPLMYKDLNDIIKYSNHKGIKNGLVTNGFLLNKLNEYVTWCRISCSDERKTPFEAIEYAIKKQPKIDWAFSYVLTKNYNLDNIKETVKFANKNNFTHVRLVSDLNDLNNVPDMRIIKNNLKGIDKLVIYQDRQIYTKGQKDCWISLLKPVIGADHQVYPCCGSQYMQKGQKKDMINPMGFAWNFEKIINEQKKYDGSKCDKCYYDSYNKVLDKFLIKPKHRSFV